MIAKKDTTTDFLWGMVESLRRDEGHSVTFINDNADFNGLPNSLIEVCGDYTGWETVQFRGDTIMTCLSQALRAKQAFDGKRAAEKV